MDTVGTCFNFCSILFARWRHCKPHFRPVHGSLGLRDFPPNGISIRLRWCGHVLRKDDDDWVKKCMEYEVEGSRPRGRPKRTWKEVVREDCQARKLNKEDAVDRCKRRKVIKEVRWQGWVWAGECFFWYRPTRVVPDKLPLNGCCCCCCCWHLDQFVRFCRAHYYCSMPHTERQMHRHRNRGTRDVCSNRPRSRGACDAA